MLYLSNRYNIVSFQHAINGKFISKIVYTISKSDISYLKHISIQASHISGTPQPHVASGDH